MATARGGACVPDHGDEVASGPLATGTDLGLGRARALRRCSAGSHADSREESAQRGYAAAQGAHVVSPRFDRTSVVCQTPLLFFLSCVLYVTYGLSSDGDLSTVPVLRFLL